MSDSPAPFTVVPASVSAVDRVSPSFIRVTFVGPGVDSVGTPGATFDQRIKLIFPGAAGTLPDLSAAGDNWYGAWLAVPEAERGSMRTYSIRDLRVEAGQTELVIDFVLHLVPGATGPASTWASGASIGDTLLLVGPRRGRLDGGGIEFEAAEGASVLLAGDETAAPAIARILEDLPLTARGLAVIEVPECADELPIQAPPGFRVHWLTRGASDHGSKLIPHVLRELGVAVDEYVVPAPETDEIVWETPQYSGSGESVDQTEARSARPDNATVYWIAGESRVVTTLRRHLVKDLGIAREQVAFMGYWRIGVAMKG